MQVQIEGMGSGGAGGIQKVADAAALAALPTPVDGDMAYQLDTDTLYVYNALGPSWDPLVTSGDQADLYQAITDLSNHISDTADAHDASAISFSPTGTVVATDAQAAIAEVSGDADTALSNAATAQSTASNHISDTTDAHDASAISVVPTGDLAATDVQAALTELQGDIDTLEGVSHAAVTLAAFGATPNANGLSLSTQALNMQPADATNPGGVSTAAQTLAGEKRLLDGANIGAVTALGASEIFKVTSTAKGAVGAPVMTTAQKAAIGTPATGLRVYDSDLKRPEYYDGTLWQSEASPNTAAAQTPADASTPTILGYRRQILPISGSGGAAVSLADLSVSNNLNGDELTILGTSDTATVTVVAATNTVINGSCTLTSGSTLTLVLYSSKWYEKGRS